MPRTKTADELRRHVSAARAHHTGLIADTSRLRAAVSGLTKHLNVIRHPDPPLDAKLVATEQCCSQLTRLENLGTTWRDTFSDLRRSMRRVRFHLRRHVKT
jgi:hypothetical protein